MVDLSHLEGCSSGGRAVVSQLEGHWCASVSRTVYPYSYRGDVQIDECCSVKEL